MKFFLRMCLLLTLKFFLKGPALWRPEAGGCSSGWSWRDIPLNLVSPCLLWSGARQRRKSGTDTYFFFQKFEFQKVLQSKNSMRSMCEVIFLGRWRKRRKDGDAEITCTKSWGLQSQPSVSNLQTLTQSVHIRKIPWICHCDVGDILVKVSLEKACCNSGDSFAYIDMAGCLHSYIK